MLQKFVFVLLSCQHIVRTFRASLCETGQKKKVSYRRRLSPFFGQVRKIKDQYRDERSKQAFSQGSNASKVRVRSHKLSVHCANFQSFALRNRSKKKVSYRRRLSPFFGQVRKIKDQRRNERSKQAFSQGSNASKVRVRSLKPAVHRANFQSFALRNGSKKEGLLSETFFFDPYENRTRVCAVRGRRLSRLTNGPLP